MRTVLVALAVVLVAGCSEDDGMTRDRLSEALVEQGLFDGDDADCIADVVFAELSDEEVGVAWEALREGADPPPAMRDALVSGVEACVEIGGE